MNNIDKINPKVTIVSYFYIVKSKFPKETYFEWIKNYLYIGFKSIIFTNKETESILIEKFPDIKKHNILIIYEINDFFTSKYDWTYDYQIDYEKQKHSIDLYKLWNEKIFFLDKACEINPFKSTYFLLIDIGSFRNKNKLDEIKQYNFPTHHNFIENKMSMFYWQFFNKDIIKNYNIIDSRFHQENTEVSTFTGGLFGGDKNSIYNFKSKYIDLLEYHKQHKIFSGKDQNIYNFLVLNNPELINYINSNVINKDYDPWFCFHYYFSNYFITNISILLPIYNNIEFLEECLDSLNNQTFKNFEILIGIKQFQEYYKKCKTIINLKKFNNINIKIYDFELLEDNNSKYQILNLLKEKSSYNLISTINVVDKWEKTKLEKQIVYVNKYDIITTKCNYFGNLLNISIDSLEINNINIESSILFKKNINIFSKNIIEKYNTFNNFIQIHNYKFINLNENLTHRRVY